MPLPVSPDLYALNPDQLRQDAERFVTSEVEAGAVRLINASPTKQQIDQYAGEIKGYADGLPIMDLYQLKDLTIQDCEEIGREIAVKVARSYGLPTSVKDIENILKKNLTELARENLGQFANTLTEAISSYGLENFANNFSAVSGLVTMTADILKDGRITQGEAMSFAASAMTTASTVFASSALAVGLGAIGGVLAPVAAGVVILEGILSAERAANRVAMEAAKKQIGNEQAVIDGWLKGDAEKGYNSAYQYVWQQKDNAIGSVAEAWQGYEDNIGKSFELRYFPGTPPPLRAGWYRNTPRGMEKVPCDNLAGCLYFPGSSSFSKIQDALIYWANMQKEGLLIGQKSYFDPKYHAMNPYHFGFIAENAYGGDLYAYYWRTMRAFDALVPNQPASDGLPSGFWVHPGHERRGKQVLRDYGLLAWDWKCSVDPHGCQTFCTYPSGKGCTISDATKRTVGIATVTGKQYAHNQARTKNPLDMGQEAIDYVQEKFARLEGESDSVKVYRTRVLGDVIQTANAVRGEMETTKQLAGLAKTMGQNNLSFATMDSAAKSKVRVLDDETRVVLGSLQKKKDSADSLKNTGVLLAGGLAAAGTYWWAKKWR